MGRGRHQHCWTHVTEVENGNKWICKYCKIKFSGGATRIEAHLAGRGGGIRRCSKYPSNNEGVYSTHDQVHDEDQNVQAKVSDEENKKDSAEVIVEDSEAQDDDHMDVEDSKEETELTAFEDEDSKEQNVQAKVSDEENKKDTAEVIVEDFEAQDDDHMDVAEHQNVQIEDSKEETELTALENVQNIEPQHVHVEEVPPNNDDISFSVSQFQQNIQDECLETASALQKCLINLENQLGLNVEEVTPNNNGISIAQFDLIEDKSTSFGTALELENFPCLDLHLGNEPVLNVEEVTPNNNDISIAQFDLNIEDKSTDYDVDNYLCLSLSSSTYPPSAENDHKKREQSRQLKIPHVSDGSIDISSNFFISPPRGRPFFEASLPQSSTSKLPNICGFSQSLGTLFTNDSAPEMKKDEVPIPIQIPLVAESSRAKKRASKALKTAKNAHKPTDIHAKFTETTSYSSAGSVSVSSNFFIPPPRDRPFYEAAVRHSLDNFVTNNRAKRKMRFSRPETFVAELSRSKRIASDALKTAKKTHKLTCLIAKWIEANAPALAMKPPIFDDPTLFDP